LAGGGANVAPLAVFTTIVVETADAVTAPAGAKAARAMKNPATTKAPMAQRYTSLRGRGIFILVSLNLKLFRVSQKVMPLLSESVP